MSLKVFRVNGIRMGEKVADSQKINTDRIIRSSFAEQESLKGVSSRSLDSVFSDPFSLNLVLSEGKINVVSIQYTPCSYQFTT